MQYNQTIRTLPPISPIDGTGRGLPDSGIPAQPNISNNGGNSASLNLSSNGLAQTVAKVLATRKNMAKFPRYNGQTAADGGILTFNLCHTLNIKEPQSRRFCCAYFHIHGRRIGLWSRPRIKQVSGPKIDLWRL